MEENGCASSVFNISLFTGSIIEQHFKDYLDVNVTVTEEGTGECVANTVEKGERTLSRQLYIIIN